MVTVASRDVNLLFHGLCAMFNEQDPKIGRFVKMPSRVGHVISCTEPFTIEYTNPRFRVLFHEGRDANPFFHLYEAMWMLAGANDLESLTKYVKRFSDFSDDGVTLWGAYGYRWKYWFGYDQLSSIILELKKDKYSRRCVLGMWDPAQDLSKAIYGGKDVPCNTHIKFRIVPDPVFGDMLNMIVHNRSNDLILGALGANVVHMSFLHEYMAEQIGVPMGSYFQISDDMHVYTNGFEPEKWLAEPAFSYADLGRSRVGGMQLMDLQSYRDPATFHKELFKFVKNPQQQCWNSPFLERVAKPMMMAHDMHKRGNTALAIKTASEHVASDDWRLAAVNWLSRRLNKDKK